MSKVNKKKLILPLHRYLRSVSKVNILFHPPLECAAAAGLPHNTEWYNARNETSDLAWGGLVTGLGYGKHVRAPPALADANARSVTYIAVVVLPSH